MTAVAIARHLSLDGVARRIPATLRFALCFLVLAGLLATMIGQRALILRDGREVRLTIVPVDPRDLFRGDYVVLTYDISEIRLDRVAGDKEFAGGDDVHVTLRPGADGRAVAVAVHRTAPAVGGADVVMRGRVLYAGRYGRTAGGRADCADTCSLIGVAYGIESYFVPEGQGRAIETTEKSRLEIVAAVGRSGEAAIKRLLLDGEMLYAEPLY
ncbi:MAG: GDYXXLXY domain-containing protein [Alphaproteobacteria bacterium]|nr:GDYXXLXY domain-containing protein [Alphaproteobacteria bacterium]